MQKILSLAISFVICFVFGIADIWPWFALSFVLLSFPDISESIWEIPLGAMSISVLTIFCRDYTDILLSVLLIASSVIFAIAKPQKLLIFYPLCVVALFFFPSNESIVFSMAASLWCACRYSLYLRQVAV